MGAKINFLGFFTILSLVWVIFLILLLIFSNNVILIFKYWFGFHSLFFIVLIVILVVNLSVLNVLKVSKSKFNCNLQIKSEDIKLIFLDKDWDHLIDLKLSLVNREFMFLVFSVTSIVWSLNFIYGLSSNFQDLNSIVMIYYFITFWHVFLNIIVRMAIVGFKESPNNLWDIYIQLSIHIAYLITNIEYCRIDSPNFNHYLIQSIFLSLMIFQIFFSLIVRYSRLGGEEDEEDDNHDDEISPEYIIEEFENSFQNIVDTFKKYNNDEKLYEQINHTDNYRDIINDILNTVRNIINIEVDFKKNLNEIVMDNQTSNKKKENIENEIESFTKKVTEFKIEVNQYLLYFVGFTIKQIVDNKIGNEEVDFSEDLDDHISEIEIQSEDEKKKEENSDNDIEED